MKNGLVSSFCVAACITSLFALCSGDMLQEGHSSALPIKLFSLAVFVLSFLLYFLVRRDTASQGGNGEATKEKSRAELVREVATLEAKLRGSENLTKMLRTEWTSPYCTEELVGELNRTTRYSLHREPIWCTYEVRDPLRDKLSCGRTRQVRPPDYYFVLCYGGTMMGITPIYLPTTVGEKRELIIEQTLRVSIQRVDPLNGSPSEIEVQVTQLVRGREVGSTFIPGLRDGQSISLNGHALGVRTSLLEAVRDLLMGSPHLPRLIEERRRLYASDPDPLPEEFPGVMKGN